MDEVTDYLFDPVKSGVIVARVALSDVSEVILSFKTRTEEQAERGAGKPEQLVSLREQSSIVEELNALVGEQSQIDPNQEEMLVNWVSSAIQRKGGLIIDWTMSASAGPDGSLQIKEEKNLSKKLKSFKDECIFGPDIVMSKLEDAVRLSESATDSILILEMVSIKTVGVQKYLELLKLLGFSEANCQVILPPTKIHSSRYAYAPFVPIMEMWLSASHARKVLPQYLIEYLRASMSYFKKSEWRTCIVLSAIAVETVLAELYEEEFHKSAPDQSLGVLHKSITNKIGKDQLLTPVDSHIKRVNAARIAAAHRGTRQVSQRESIDALRAAMKVAIWYYFVDTSRRYQSPM